MNRCITCGKLVARPKAQNTIEYNRHEYLVCCPLCEKEFNRDPEYHVAVLRATIGDYAMKAHSQASYANAGTESATTDENDLSDLHLLQHLETSFAVIKQRFVDLEKHFEEVAGSGGINGLRNALNKHRMIMDELRNDIMIFTGVCKFVTTATQSSAKAKA